MHLNMVKGDFIVGYSTEECRKYDKKVKELLAEGYKVIDVDHSLSGDMHEYFEKDGHIFTITHLAI